MENKLTVSISPHIHSGKSIRQCMWNVVIALLPALAISFYTFGLPALAVTVTSVAACLLAEWAIDRLLLKRRQTLADGSAVITGLLLAMNVPSILPWWMVVIGAVVAIGIGKMSFGGLGQNIWNPALVGRVFLLLSFPAAMTTWPTGIPSGADASTGATFLVALNAGQVDASTADMAGLLIGNMNGSAGEVGAIAILTGLAYLLLTRTVTWHIPVSILASAALLSWALGGSPLLDLLS